MSTKSERKPNTRRSGNRRKPKHGNREDFKKDEILDAKDMKNSSNDPRWYGHSEQLLKDAASYPFTYTQGLAVPGLMRTNIQDMSQTPIYQKEVFPGVMSFTMIPAFGWSNNTSGADLAQPDPTTPFNVAANKLFTKVRTAISGTRPYDAPDLMIFVRAMCECYSFLVWARRAYGVSSLWPMKNRYIPRTLLEIQNIDADNILNHLSDYRYGLNLLTHKIASLKVPADMDIFHKAAFIYQDVYSEGTVEKDQLYLYQPEGFCSFSLDEESKGCLVYHPLTEEWGDFKPSGRLTYEDILTYGTQLFEAIWQEEEFTTMSGDLDKTYGGDLLTLYTIGDDYTTAIKFDPAVLTQMQNTKILPSCTSTTTGLLQYAANNYTPWLAGNTYLTFDLTNDTGKREFAAAVSSLTSDQILTINADSPDPHMIIEATRNMAVKFATAEEVGISGKVWLAVADFTCVGMSIARIDSTTFDTTVEQYRGTFLFNQDAAQSPTRWSKYLVAPRSFKYCPEIDYYAYDHDEPNFTYAERGIAVDNWTVLSPYDVQKMHETAILSMLGVLS